MTRSRWLVVATIFAAVAGMSGQAMPLIAAPASSLVPLACLLGGTTALTCFIVSR